jgi:hypothetical protein
VLVTAEMQCRMCYHRVEVSPDVDYASMTRTPTHVAASCNSAHTVCHQPGCEHMSSRSGQYQPLSSRGRYQANNLIERRCRVLKAWKHRCNVRSGDTVHWHF